MHVRRNAGSKTCVSLLWLTAFLISPALYAGDEDMSPSAYHVFDPETGYMMTVDPQSAEQPATTPPGEGALEADANTTTALQDEQTKAGSQPRYWLYLIAGILIVVGFIAWVRDRGNMSSNKIY